MGFRTFGHADITQQYTGRFQHKMRKFNSLPTCITTNGQIVCKWPGLITSLHNPQWRYCFKFCKRPSLEFYSTERFKRLHRTIAEEFVHMINHNKKPYQNKEQDGDPSPSRTDTDSPLTNSSPDYLTPPEATSSPKRATTEKYPPSEELLWNWRLWVCIFQLYMGVIQR